MQSLIQYTDETPSSTMQLHIYEGRTPSRFEYYEDDGKSFDYRTEVYYKRVITYDPESGLTLSKVQGSYESKFSEVEVVFHSKSGSKHLDSVKMVDKEMKVKLSNE